MSVPAAYIGVILIWSTTPLAIQWSSQGVGFLFAVVARMSLGLVVCLVLMRLTGRRLSWDRAARRTYLAGGLGLYAAMLSVYWAAQLIPSGWIAVVFGLAPIVTGLMAGRWLGEAGLTPARLAGMVLGACGLVLIFASGRELGPDAALGVVGVLFSVIVHSGSAIAVKRLGVGLPALSVATGALGVAVPLYVLTYAFGGAPIPAEVPLRGALAIVYLGLIGSVLGFVLYFYVLRRVEATRVALITLVTPVIALLVGQWLNGEPVAPGIWLGAGLVLFGLAAFELSGLMGRAAAGLVVTARGTAGDE